LSGKKLEQRKNEMTNQVTVNQAIEMMEAEMKESFISVGNASFTSRNGSIHRITRTNNFADVVSAEEAQAELEANLHFNDGALDLRMNELDGEIFIVA